MSENTSQPEHPNTAPAQGQMYIPPQYYQAREDEIDLRELFGVLWKGKWWIIGITTLFAIASVFYALSLPNEYKATAIVVPASSDSANDLGRLAGQFGGLATLAGINLGGGESNDAVIAMEIMKTWGFQEEFIKNHNLEIPIFAAKGWDVSTNELILDDELYDSGIQKWVESVGKSESPTSWELHEKFNPNLSVHKDKELGLISISYVHYSPELAQQIVSWLVNDINHLMKQRALSEASSNIDYLNTQISKTSLAEMQGVFYKLIEEQTKNKMLAEVSDEFVYKYISRPKSPEIKDRPKRSILVIIFTLVGFLVSNVFVLVRSIFAK